MAMSSTIRRSAAAAALLGSQLVGAQQSPVPTTRFIEVEPNVRIEVVDWGGTGRPVVLMHGHGRSAHDFDAFAPRLAATNRVVAISRRGYGASSKPATGYSADRLADDVLAIIDSLGLVAPVLAGHSIAGEELSSIGSRHPEKVAGLVYLDAGYQYAFYDSALVSDNSNDFINPNEVKRGLDELFLASVRGNAEEARRLISRLLKTDLPELEQTLRDLERRTPLASTNPPRSVIMRVRPGPDQEIFRGLQRFTDVRAPVLAIYALKGGTTQLADWKAGRRGELRALERASPSARTLILPNAGHDVFNSASDEVLRAMRAFMATLPLAPKPSG